MYKIPLLAKVVSLYIVLAIPVTLTVSIFSNSYNPYIAQAAALGRPEIVKPPVVSGKPVQLLIPRLGINLPVQPGNYDPATGTWTLSNTAIFFTEITAPINDQAGHTLIYGHAYKNLLEPTKDLSIDDELIITTDTGYSFSYRYTGKEVVNPKDTAVLQKTSDKPLLTLLTCEGIFYENRRLMSFELTGAKQL